MDSKYYICKRTLTKTCQRCKFMGKGHKCHHFFLMVCSFNANEKNIYKYYPHFVFSKVLAWKIASLRIYGCTHLCMSFCGLYFHRQDSPLRQVALTTSHFIKVGEAHIIQPKLWITNWQLPLLNRWTVLLYNSHTHTHNAQRWRLSKCIQCIVDRIYRACVFFLPQIFYFSSPPFYCY